MGCEAPIDRRPASGSGASRELGIVPPSERQPTCGKELGKYVDAMCQKRCRLSILRNLREECGSAVQHIRVRVLVIAFLLLGSVGLRAVVSPEARSNYVWFSTLGFPDVKNLPFVRVATGRGSDKQGENPTNSFLMAFLRETNGNEFSVFTTQLSRRTFTNTVSGNPIHRQVYFEPASLAGEATRTVAAYSKSWRRPENFIGDWLPERVEVFFLGWACWRHGLEVEAEQLYRTAEPMHAGHGKALTNARFRTTLEQDLGHHVMWLSLLDFRNIALSRTDLMGQFEAVATNYSHAAESVRAREFAGRLRTMIQEDQAHIHPPQYSDLTVAEQVRDLIFHLRDQQGCKISYPGGYDYFGDWAGATNTAAHQLARMGYATVPQLIDALESTAFTRGLDDGRPWFYSDNVVTVGFCAGGILQKITGSTFDDPRKARAWWQEFQRQGEQAMLTRAVMSSEKLDTVDSARLLRTRYPGMAARILIKAANACDQSWARAPLVNQLAQLNDDDVHRFLIRQIRRETDAQCLQSIAYGLRRHGRELAVREVSSRLQDSWLRQTNDLRITGLLLELLAATDSTNAISFLAANFNHLEPQEKVAVFHSLQRGTNPPAGVPIALREEYKFELEAQQSEPRSLATLAAIERFAALALLDPQDNDPRICDLAAEVLSQLWPGKYHFAPEATLPLREQQRLACLNVWQKHNQPLPFKPADGGRQ